MEQTDRNMTIRNHWLHERSMLFEKYAVNMPTRADRIDLQLDYPDCGWIDMHFYVNGEEKVVIDTSYVYEPFVDIKEWLENIVSHIFDFNPTGVNIYNECYNFLLYYEPLFIQTDDQMTPNPQELYGLFYVYDGTKEKWLQMPYVRQKNSSGASIRRYWISHCLQEKTRTSLTIGVGMHIMRNVVRCGKTMTRK